MSSVPLPDLRDLRVYKLLHKIVCALGDQPQFVIISTRGTRVSPSNQSKRVTTKCSPSEKRDKLMFQPTPRVTPAH
jgi:hypothetical protein